MLDSGRNASEGGVEETRSTGRTLLAVLIPALIFVAGGATAIIGDRLISDGTGDAVRVIGFEDWRVICPPTSEADQNCTLSLEVIPNQVSLTLNDPAPGSPIRIVVPHGVFLEPGLGVSVGDQPLEIYPYATCLPGGCFADIPLEAAMIELMRTNMNGQIVVVPAAGSPVTIPYSLNGFADGYASLQEERDNRNSMWGFLTR